MDKAFWTILVFSCLISCIAYCDCKAVISYSSSYDDEITFIQGTTGNTYKYSWLVDQRQFVGEYYIVYDNNFYWYEGNWTVGEEITITFDSLDLGDHNITVVNYGTYVDAEGGIFCEKDMILVHVIPSQTADSLSVLVMISGLIIYSRHRN